MSKLGTKLRIAGAAPLALMMAGCMGAGGSIPSASTPITQTEAQQGAQYHPQLVAEFGGEVDGPLATYVEQVGKDMVVQSGNTRASFNVSLLDSSVNNAFAVPGGYIYTTRQLVSLMDNEAELAAVMGHEVGHVVARHSARRQARAQRNSIFGVLGAIGAAVLLGDSQIGNLLGRGAAQAPQLLTLAYSREQEEEADRLGIDYMSAGGYDPRAMATLLERLSRQVDLDARLQGRENARPPVWASTHPEPVARVRLANAYASGKPGTALNRNTFLNQIDGMIYGDNPAQGVIEGSDFIHPDLRLRFSAPQGFYMINSTRSVSVNGQGGQAELTLAPYNGDLTSYVRQQFAELGGQNRNLAPQSIERTTVNGLPAAFGITRVSNNNGQVDLVVYAYEFGNDRAFHFVAITPAGRSNTFSSMFQSMRRISANEAAQIIPRRIDVVTVQRGDTVSGLARRMAFDNAREDRFRVLNGLGPNDGLIAGTRVKLVVRGR